MPNQFQHNNQIKTNKQFLNHIQNLDNRCLDWEIIVVFLVALHYVEVYFATKNIHSSSHKRRDTNINNDRKIKAIYRDYKYLKAKSEDTRYRCRHYDEKYLKTMIIPSFENIEKVISLLI